MHDPSRVRRIQRIRNLDRQLQPLIQRQRRAGNSLLQRLTIQKLHGDERAPIRLANFIDGADIRMVQRRSSLRLALKSSERLAIARQFIGKEFQSHKAVQRGVLSLKHHTHSAATKFLQHPVVRNHPPR